MPSLERQAALFIIAEQNGCEIDWETGNIREGKR